MFAVFGARAQAPADFDAGDFRQHPIEEDEIGLALLDQHQRLFAFLGDGHRVAFALEIVLKERRKRFLVFDHDHCRFDDP